MTKKIWCGKQTIDNVIYEICRLEEWRNDYDGAAALRNFFKNDLFGMDQQIQNKKLEFREAKIKSDLDSIKLQIGKEK